MKPKFTIPFLTLFFILLSFSVFAQDFTGDWSVEYATVDEQSNGTGYNTISVAVTQENTFAALVRTTSANAYFLLGYRDADSTQGRLGNYAYGGGLQDKQTLWVNFFDQQFIYDAKSVAHWKDDIVIVANNDDNHNLLAFEILEDTIGTYAARLETGTDPIWAIHCDDNDHVFVTTEGDDTNPSKVLVYQGPDNNSNWSSGHAGTALTEIELPDLGSARGVTSNSDGTSVFVSNFEAEKIYNYKGSPEEGYTLNTEFSFDLNDTLSSETDTLLAGMWEVDLMPDKNILFAAADFDFAGGFGYQYGRIYAVNPNDGTILDTIDVADWNFQVNGVYDNRNQQNGISSGYTSPYAVDFDENYNVYSVSFFGWTVDKWVYSDELPTIVTDIKLSDNLVPNNYNLEQNYPNPFNPTTSINFSIPEKSNISLEIYSITGELVGKLVDSEYYNAGNYTVDFNAANLASGTYIYRLTTGDVSISKKMILLK